jgi:signal transduction histidine kinase
VAAAPVLALPALLGRYRRSTTPVRRQIGLVVAAGAVTVVGTIASIAAGGPTSSVGLAVLLLTQPLPALAIAVAIVRHRLWGVELVVSRTVVHVVLWAAVSAAFLVPAALSGALVGGTPAMSAVLVALLVTLAFQPVRDRLERSVEAVVYRHRPRGYALLARIGTELEQAADVPALARRTVSGVREGLGVRWAELWVAQEYGDRTALRLAGSTDPARSDTVRRVLLDAPAEAARLDALWDEPPALVEPMVAGESFLGVLACGDRPGDPLRDADGEVLDVIARACALALRTRRLESQLRDRLEEIEARAAELRRSRERIVSAQDAERRRIGRDLHDGVQQHVLGLVMSLRSASPDLRRLADDTEALVFELQDLARGIFPSVLVDHGLEEALRSQIGRTPGQVRLDVAPAVSGLRVEPAVESAAWFIVLEALANAAKHAPGSPVTVTLSGTGDRLLVEVHDHGPGFDKKRAPRGHGLQNMADRAAAVGGTCTVDSRPGRGTWVRVELPLTAQVVALPQPGLP